MKTSMAILFTLGLIVSSMLIAVLINVDVSGLMVAATSLWAAVDSSRIGLKRYHSYIAHGPVVLFIACGLLWIICFPWYLSQRYKITHGMAVLKTEAERALDKKGAVVQAWLVGLFLVLGVAVGWRWGGWPNGVGFGAIGGMILGVLVGGGIAIVIRSRSCSGAAH